MATKSIAERLVEDKGKQKPCTRCGIEKAANDFYLRGDHSGSLRPECKKCSRLYADPQKERQQQREYHLRRFYGIDTQQYEQMYEAQHGLCAICGCDPRKKYEDARMRLLQVDHCHDSGAVRGLLCSGCNVALGRWSDNLALLEAAVAYLRRGL